MVKDVENENEASGKMIHQWNSLEANLFPSFFHHLKLLFCHRPFSYDCFHARNFGIDNFYYFWHTAVVCVRMQLRMQRNIFSTFYFYYYHYLWFDLTIVDRRTYIKYSDSFLPPYYCIGSCNEIQRQRKPTLNYKIRYKTLYEMNEFYIIA